MLVYFSQMEFESILNESSDDEEESGIQASDIPTSQLPATAMQVQRNESTGSTARFENLTDRDEASIKNKNTRKLQGVQARAEAITSKVQFRDVVGELFRRGRGSLAFERKRKNCRM